MPRSLATEQACQSLEDIRGKLDPLSRPGDQTPAQLQSVLDECPDAVLVTDLKARIVHVNGMAARVLGTTARELQKLTIWDITHASYQIDFDILWKEFVRARRQMGHYGLRHANDTLVEVAYCAEVHMIPDRTLIVARRLS